MAPLGLLLCLAAAAFTADVVVQNSVTVSGTVFGQSITGLSVGRLLVAGALAGLVFAIGFALMARGLRRARTLRGERRAAIMESRRLRAENDRLAANHSISSATSSDPAYPEESSTDTRRARRHAHQR